MDHARYDSFYEFKQDHTFTGYRHIAGKRYNQLGKWELRVVEGETRLFVTGRSGSEYLEEMPRVRRSGNTLTLDHPDNPDFEGLTWVYQRQAGNVPPSAFSPSQSHRSGYASDLLSPLNVIIGLVVVLLIVRWLLIKDKHLTILSRWHHLYENLSESSKESYSSIEAAVRKRVLPEVRLERVDHREGGIFSAKREYLRARRRELIFDICAAPFGNGFFFSWWLGEKPSAFWTAVLLIPVLGPWLFNRLRPVTYYRLDTATMFQDSIHSAVLEVIDGLTKAKGLRGLSEAERKPIMHEFFKR